MNPKIKRPWPRWRRRTRRRRRRRTPSQGRSLRFRAWVPRDSRPFYQAPKSLKPLNLCQPVMLLACPARWKDEKPKDEEAPEEEEPDVSAFRPAHCTRSPHLFMTCSCAKNAHKTVMPLCKISRIFSRPDASSQAPYSPCCALLVPLLGSGPGTAPGPRTLGSGSRWSCYFKESQAQNRDSNIRDNDDGVDDDDGVDHDHGDACHLLCSGRVVLYDWIVMLLSEHGAMTFCK